MKTLKNHLRNFDKYRKEKMKSLESLLFRLISHDRYHQKELIPHEEVKEILIVRNNKRIGNMYFLIPFIRKTMAAYPHAKISLLLNEPWQGEVFKNLGIKDIYYSYFSFKHITSLFKTITQLRQQQYDLVFIPNSSAGDTIMGALVPAKNKISTFDEHRQQALTHAFVKNDHRAHMALSSLYLLSEMGNTLSDHPDHLLAFSEDELAKGKAAFDAIAATDALNIAYFRGARGDKVLTDAQWTQILDRFATGTDQPIHWIEILSPDIPKTLVENRQSFQSKDMRHLAAVLRHADAFICCDTGPLHLADAADAPCIGLYNKTDPTIFGVIGQRSQNVIDIEHFDAKAIFQTLQS